MLDFGLARALEPASAASANVTASPTITSPAMMTGVGVILGTAAYIIPEQAKGRPADRRSDIWSFGCVLYEMLSGARPFGGEDVAETLGGILTKEPDWSTLPDSVPVGIRTLLQRCLTKDRKHRLDSRSRRPSRIRRCVDESRSGRNDSAGGSTPPHVANGRFDRVLAGACWSDGSPPSGSAPRQRLRHRRPASRQRLAGRAAVGR